ncbi:polyprenyl synthetase family protein, partial [Gordonia amicalis]|nr:polyprenyl synthetase family protein [Gordonia amicalis]
ADDSVPALGRRLRTCIGRAVDDDELGSARALLVVVAAGSEMEGKSDDLLGAALAALDAPDSGDDIRTELTAVAHR